MAFAIASRLSMCIACYPVGITASPPITLWVMHGVAQ
ncbi:Uncharacterised protein [Enterobacter hormaechei]|nr:Uncharacterised protein [Enterobacter hormaechei]